jgi:hypothetical protein
VGVSTSHNTVDPHGLLTGTAYRLPYRLKFCLVEGSNLAPTCDMSGDAVVDGATKKYAVCCTCGALIACSGSNMQNIATLVPIQIQYISVGKQTRFLQHVNKRKSDVRY